MNRVSGRSRLVLVLVLVLLVGLGVFLIRYFTEGEEWATFSGSPQIYSSGNLSLGTVTDRSGTLLLDCSDGRTYSTDLSLRKSIIHILGDRYGYIAAPLLSYYTSDLIEYNAVSGLYDAEIADRCSTLTISSSAQKTAENLMEGRRGVVAVYNYKTGEILCVVSAPNYDPDDVPDIENDTTGMYTGAYVNRFYKSSYTPGSIFKVVTLSAALETLPDALDLTFTCEGSCIIGGEEIICSGIHGTQTLSEAFSNSCNCAFAELSQLLGADTLTQYVTNAGLTDSYDQEGITVAAGHFDLTGASAGSVSWAGVGQYTDLVNPYTYLTYMGMIAGRGTAAKPYLMKQIQVGEEITYSAEIESASFGLREETCEVLVSKMRDNVIQKYGQWQFPDLKVCAKSGTAETGEDNEPNAMFAGFIDDPDFPLAFLVVVEEGGYGASTAAPIAGSVLQACVDTMLAER